MVLFLRFSFDSNAGYTMNDILESMMSPNIEASSGSNALVGNDIHCSQTPNEQEEKRIEASQCEAVIDSKCIKKTGYNPTSICGVPEPYCEEGFKLLNSRKEGTFTNNTP